MKHLFRRSLSLGLSLQYLLVGQVLAQDLVIGDFSLVGRERTGRTEFAYIYRAEISNTGPTVRNVIATMTIVSPCTAVINDTLSFGDVPASVTVTGENIFTLRQDRRVAFDPSILV